MKKFFQKQREVLIIFAYVGIFAGLIYLVVLPLLARINAVNDQIQEESMKQEVAQKQLEELPKLQQQYDELGKDADSVDVLLDENKAVVLIERLEKIAADSSNKISISVQDAPAQKNVAASMATKGKTTVDNTLVGGLPSSDYLKMTITLDGNYNTIMNFVDALESCEYYSDIVGIQIKQNDAKDKSTTQSGATNPFVANSKTDTQISGSATPEDLEALIDVVFYTKK